MTKINQSAVIIRADLMNVIHYDPKTGEFSWKERAERPGYFANRKPGVVATNGRLYIGINGVRYLAHRLAWFYVTGAWPKANISPKDGDYLNLRFSNLKEEPQSATSRKAKRSMPSSGIRGVFWDSDKGKWRAEITVNYKNHLIGRFATKEEAERAYKKALRKLHTLDGHSAERAADEREIKRSRANMRRLWRRTLKASGGVTGWDTFEQFSDDILQSSSFQEHRPILPLDPARKVGPGNWHWGHGGEMDARFDFRTAQGRASYLRDHRVSFPGRYRNGSLLRNFGITLEQYNEMLKSQNYVCAICANPERTMHKGRPRALAVDHCHKTGAVRGLLCTDCNSGIGRFDDNLALMQRAMDYIKEHAERISHSVPASSPVPLEKER